MNNARIPLSALLATTLLATAGASPGATLESVQGRGKLLCGVNTGLPGFSSVDQNGKWTGLDVDFCRAVAAATLGDADKVELKPLTAKERFTALQSGEIDLLSRNTTWTLSRDAAQGLSFTGVIYYDGQGFMVSKSLGVKSARELDGAAVCILAGTTTELNLADYFRTHDMKYEPVVFDTADQTSRGFETGRCDVLTSDQSQLYGLRIKLAEPDKAAVLPEVISKEPLGPAVRQGDDAWFNIVRWTLFALINAEELGVTADNVDAMKSSSNPEVRRLLGVEGSADSGLGLAPDWVAGVIKQVGNYGEIFQRSVGADSPLQIERGLNALWTDGGLEYAPPFR
jgi:general L-amino acid transport system substrate-binding protein